MGVGGWWSLYRAGWLVSLRKCPRYPSLASGDRVRDRRDSVRTPIPTKSRTTRSARRALRSYLTAVTFRRHFSATLKIIRLLNKRGFSYRWLRLVSRGCDGARVNPGVATVVCRGGKRPGLRSDTRIRGGKIFTDYYFGEANTANKADKLHTTQ